MCKRDWLGHQKVCRCQSDGVVDQLSCVDEQPQLRSYPNCWDCNDLTLKRRKRRLGDEGLGADAGTPVRRW